MRVQSGYRNLAAVTPPGAETIDAKAGCRDAKYERALQTLQAERLINNATATRFYALNLPEIVAVPEVGRSRHLAVMTLFYRTSNWRNTTVVVEGMPDEPCGRM